MPASICSALSRRPLPAAREGVHAGAAEGVRDEEDMWSQRAQLPCGSMRSPTPQRAAARAQQTEWPWTLTTPTSCSRKCLLGCMMVTARSNGSLQVSSSSPLNSRKLWKKELLCNLEISFHGNLRYRLSLVGIDGNAISEFVLFGRVAARQIVGKPVISLIRSASKNQIRSSADNRDHILPELDALLFQNNMTTMGTAREGVPQPLVAIGIAKGMRFLHAECRAGPIIHRNLHPSNVLLTHDFVPMLGNFSLARWKAGSAYINTRILGQSGSAQSLVLAILSAQSSNLYLAPEYAEYGMIYVRTDVYAFGILLFQLTSGRKAEPLIESLALHELVDDHIKDTYDTYGLYLSGQSCISSCQEKPRAAAFYGREGWSICIFWPPVLVMYCVTVNEFGLQDVKLE
ncbi:hypothetical protein BAE44_0025430 [Dichanthelium oligosanthes]|uniref:Protein kinase domain-containing protein n=1 Tax=Dichanthelium oligosanthes TaxID=888268 RepID=A0A1E5UKZ5_9POAL|nr:hypothetical protein BAE44_0025430 [Dichanthelium oligosanthes]